MGYGREPNEHQASFRERIAAAYAQYIGPLPQERSRSGRIVPLRLETAMKLAEYLDFAAGLELISARIDTNPLLIEWDDGRVIYLERSDEALGSPDNEAKEINDYQRVVDLLRPNTTYLAYVQRLQAYPDELEGFITRDDPALGPKIGWLHSALRRDETSGWWKQWDIGVATTGRRGTLTASKLYNFGKDRIRFNPPGYVRGWYIALVPVGDEGKEWLAMHDGETNCLVAAVKRSLKDPNARQLRILAAAEEKVKVRGANYADVDALSRALKMKIEIRDVANTILHTQAAYGNARKLITLYRSDGHCTELDPKFDPPKKVVTYCGTPPQREETKTQSHKRIINDAVRIIKKEKLANAQIIGGEVVANQVVYRSVTQDVALHIAAAEVDERPPTTAGEDYKDNAEDILEVGGVQAFRFRRWANEMFLSLWKDARQPWRDASLEFVAWRTEEAKDASHWDMRAAYLACDHREHACDGPAKQAAKVYGFPQGGRQRLSQISTLEEVRLLAGAVHFTQVSLAANTPPAIRCQLAAHFDRSGWMVIPLALWLHDHKLITATPDAVFWDPTKVPNIEFPLDRDQAVRFIGSCSYSQRRRTFFTSDEAEANHFARIHNAYPEKCEDGFLVSYPGSPDEGSDYSHVRAYVLGYLAIAMWEAALALGDDLVGTAVDALWLKAPPLGRIPIAGEAPRWGEFRLKPQPKSLGAIHFGHTTSWAFPTAEAKLPLPEPDQQRGLTVYLGQGGSGKTHRALRQFAGRKVRVLAPTNDSVADLSSEAKNPNKYRVHTFHEFFRLSGRGEYSENFDPKKMTHLLGIDVVIWDEFPLAGERFLKDALMCLRRVGVIVVLCGDPVGQLTSVGGEITEGKKIIAMLERIGAHIEHGDGEDWRAKDCPRLQAAKQKAWCQPDAVQHAALMEVATKVSLREALELWRPGDVFIEAKGRVGDDIRRLVSEKRQEKYPTEPIELEFKPEEPSKWCKKDGVLPKFRKPGTRELVPGARGSRIHVAPDAKYDEKLWRDGSVTTVHAVQGRTIEAPRRIFICVNSLQRDWAHNATYVAMSRAQKAEQLYWFQL